MKKSTILTMFALLSASTAAFAAEPTLALGTGASGWSGGLTVFEGALAWANVATAEGTTTYTGGFSNTQTIKVLSGKTWTTKSWSGMSNSGTLVVQGTFDTTRTAGTNPLLVINIGKIVVEEGGVMKTDFFYAGKSSEGTMIHGTWENKENIFANYGQTVTISGASANLVTDALVHTYGSAAKIVISDGGTWTSSDSHTARAGVDERGIWIGYKRLTTSGNPMSAYHSAGVVVEGGSTWANDIYVNVSNSTVDVRENSSWTNTVDPGKKVTLNSGASVTASGNSEISGSFVMNAGSALSIDSSSIFRGDLTAGTFTMSGSGELRAANISVDASGVTNITVAFSGNTDLDVFSAGTVDLSGTQLNVVGNPFVNKVSEINLGAATFAGSGDPVLTVNGKPVVATFDDATGTVSVEDGLPVANFAMASALAMGVATFNDGMQAQRIRVLHRTADYEDIGNFEVFAQGHAVMTRNGDNTDSATYDFDLFGVLAGADYRISEGALVGVSVGYDHGKADIHDNQGNIDADIYQANIFFGGKLSDYVSLDGGVHGARTSYDISRNGFAGDGEGDTNGWNAGAYLGFSGVFPISNSEDLLLRPHVGVSYVHSVVDSYTEKSSMGGMDVDTISADSLRANLGVALDWAFDVAEISSHFVLDVTYSYDFLGDEVDADVTTSGSSKMQRITENALSKNTLSISPSFIFDLDDRAGLLIGYQAEIGEDSIAHNFSVGVRVAF